MIIVKLQGGLGNQMFQYALGRHLAILNKTGLYLDQSLLFDDPNKRKYGLDAFNIVRSEHISVISKLNLRYNPPKSLNEKQPFICDKSIIETHGNIILTGFWQNEKYFSSVESIIRQDLKLTGKYQQCFLYLLKQINPNNSVAIHIRRKDYVTDVNANNFHGTCSIEYYKSAMGIIESKLSPHYYFFSDDINWVKKNLSTKKPATYVNWRTNHVSVDLQLMSLCKHHIIANSTFGWWGAWLGKNEKQIVIAPDPWLDSKKWDTSDIYPDSWIRLKK